MPTELINGEFKSDLVPIPVEYAVLLPDGYAESDEDYPLLYFLHGGNGDRSFLTRLGPLVERTMDSGQLPKVVAVTPSVTRSMYMDYRDGTQKWEQLLLGPFLDHLREEYRLMPDSEGILLFGISMGGMGALRMGFKYPERFAALAALEPGIEPALSFKEIKTEDRFWRSDEMFETIFGNPVDEDYWISNNPANIVLNNPEKLRDSGLGIYIECGDEDSFGLDRGTEFLHRVLRDNQISHEYHLVQGADHLGRTLGPRSQEGLAFLGSALNPPPPDPEVENLRKLITQWKKAWE